VPIDTLLRLLYLRYPYHLGYESLCQEVTGSITSRRFYPFPLDRPVPHPTTRSSSCAASAPRASST
jgi:hypothetical protein